MSLDGYDTTSIILFSVSIIAIIFFSALLLCLRKRIVSIWTKSEYLLISSVGICFIFAGHVILAYVYPAPVSEIFLFHNGMSLFYYPLIVRTWRIISIHSKTLDIFPLKCIDGSLSIRLRGHKWMLFRIAIGCSFNMLFTLLTCAGAFTPVVGDLICGYYNILTIFLMLAMAIWHIIIRKKIVIAEVNESKSLTFSSWIALIHYTIDMLVWWTVLEPMGGHGACMFLFHIINFLGLNSVFYSTVIWAITNILRSKKPAQRLSGGELNSVTKVTRAPLGDGLLDPEMDDAQETAV